MLADQVSCRKEHTKVASKVPQFLPHELPLCRYNNRSGASLIVNNIGAIPPNSMSARAVEWPGIKDAGKAERPRLLRSL